MADELSNYHGIVKPEHGKDPWSTDYYDYVDLVDSNLKKSGTLSNRPLSGDVPTGVWYEASDEKIIYRNDPTDGWTETGHGESGSRVGDSFIENLTVGQVVADNGIQANANNARDDGFWVGEKANSLTVESGYITQYSVESNGWAWRSHENSPNGSFQNQMYLQHDGRLKIPNSTASDPEDVVTKSELDDATGSSQTAEVVDRLSITGWKVVDVANNGFPGDQTGGDLAQFIADNTSAGSKNVFKLPAGTYNWNRPLHFTGDAGNAYDEDRPELIALVGEPDATIYVDIGSSEAPSDRRCFTFGTNSSGVNNVILKNIDFDVGNHSSSRDAGICRANIGEYALFENLYITGRRRWKSGTDGSSSDKNGDRHTLKVDCLNKQAQAYIKDCEFPEGDIYESGAETAGHAIPFASEDSHEGTNYWKNCYVEGFIDNGYYLRDGHGSNFIVNSTAKDNGAGNFRLGRNDRAENITSIASGAQSFNCTPIWVEEHRNTDPYDVGTEDDSPIVVDGFEIRAMGEPVNDVIRCSNDPPETVLRNGYVRCSTDDFVIDATHTSGKLTVENVTVDDEATGNTRVAAMRFNADNIDVRNMTYRQNPPSGENGRSIFRIDGTRIHISDSYLFGSYHPMLEVYGGADYTLRDNKCPHDGSVSSPYVIRHNQSPDAAWIVDNDFTDYSSLIGTGSSTDYNFYVNRGNRGP